MLSHCLNSRILALAPRYSVADHAPSTFAELSQDLTQRIVWTGGSESTIYGDPRVNWAFRAWHDGLHITLNAPFTLEGETRVAIEQARLVQSDLMARVILAEVIGQAEYFSKHGQFPLDQMAFIVDYLKGTI